MRPRCGLPLLTERCAALLARVELRDLIAKGIASLDESQRSVLERASRDGLAC
jgi:hypothetical protein